MKMSQTWTRLRSTLALFALYVASSLTLRVAVADYRAHQTVDLLGQEARQTSARARDIVHGTDSDIDRMAVRHHVQMTRPLNDAALLLANSKETTALAADPAIVRLSGDVPVRAGMQVSNKTTAADQTRTAASGLISGARPFTTTSPNAR